MSSTTVDPSAGRSPDRPAEGGGTTLTHRDVPLAHADGVTLIGEMEGSGYREAPSLVRRGDGQTVQLTALLYAVLAEIDGTRTPAQVADAVAARIDRPVNEENVWTLVETQLRPLGLLVLVDGSQPETKKSNPLLGLRFKYVVSDPERTRKYTAPFAALFAPVVVAVVTLAFLATAGWVLFDKGLAAATSQAFDRPGLLLLVFAITALSAGFHEFGHAAACRYGGATPGAMGAGLYLVWPAFYTEVTDSYKLGRAGRVRVDLGGLYFNAIVAVAMFGVWAASQFDALLLIIAAQVLQMLRQLAPLVRFDGYHILADVTGVPDLYSRIGPTLKGLLPTQWGKPEHKVLKPWARAVVATWVIVVVPLLLAAVVLMVVTLPRVAATAWVGLEKQWGLLGEQLAEGDPVGIPLRILGIVSIALPVAASVYLLVRLVRRIGGGLWRSTSDHPVRRGLLVATVVAIIAALLWVWWPKGDTYRPIQASERGTVLDALPVASASPALRDGQVGQAQSLYASTEAPPTKEEPQLALVLVAKDGDAPTWVFPFDRPDAPGLGDNQALAVNTADGSTVYDVAFALVWAEDGQVLNTNEAYAFASCKKCTTVAIGFQVVLVVGQADVVIPQNLSGAVNYNCVQCVTYALAQQLVVSLPRGLSPAAMAELDAVWAQVEALGQNIRGLKQSQIRAQLTDFERQILDIVERDTGSAESTQSTSSARATASSPAATATGSGSTAPAPAGSSSPPAAEQSPQPSGSTSQSPSPSTSPSPTPTGSATGTATSTATGTATPAP